MEDLSEMLIIFRRGLLGLSFSRHAVNIFGRNLNLGQQTFLRHAKIAVLVIRRDTALVAPKKMNAEPVDTIPILGSSEQRVQSSRRRAAGKRHGELSGSLNCVIGEPYELLRRLAVQLIDISANDDLALNL